MHEYQQGVPAGLAKEYISSFFASQGREKGEKIAFDFTRFVQELEELATLNKVGVHTWNFRSLSQYANPTQAEQIYNLAVPIIIRNVQVDDYTDLGQLRQTFGLVDQRASIILAKYLAQTVGSFSKYISQYAISDQQALIDIAKLATQHKFSCISDRIKDYNIGDESALIDIAKLAAQENGIHLSMCIHHYGIKDEKALFEIFKGAVEQSGLQVIYYLKYYGIKDESLLLEIARFCAKRDVHQILRFIEGFKVLNQVGLIEIAKLVAQKDGTHISSFIQNYGIKDKSQLAEIAKLAAAQNGMVTSCWISNYGLDDQAQLVEIAMLAAQCDGENTSRYIQNYGIKDPIRLVEIAKLAAVQNSKGTFRYIQNYGITDAIRLMEIAEIAIQYDGINALGYIEDSGIKEGVILISLAKMAAIQLGDKLNLDVRSLVEALTEPQNGHITQINIKWLLNSLDKLSRFKKLASVTRSATKNKQLLDTLTKCANIHHPALRKGLVNRAWPALNSSKVSALFTQLCQQKAVPQLFFPQLFSAALLKKGLSQDAIISKILPPLYQLNQKLKDKNLYEPLYGIMQLWLENESLTAADILFMANLALDKVAIQDKMQLIERLKMLCSIANMATGSALQKAKLESYSPDPSDLKNYFAQLFCQKIPVQPRPNLAIDLEQKFFSQRDGTALMRYASGLYTLAEEERQKALQALGAYVENALKGQVPFSKWRLDSSNNPHLHAIFQVRPDLRRSWPLLIDRPLVASAGYRLLITDNYYDLLLSGTEVGSCQKVDNSDPGLLGYLIHGQNRLLIIKNAVGKICARSILRLAWDATAQQPLLFLAKLYPQDIPENHREAMLALARAQAMRLKLSLLSSAVGEGDPYPHAICGLGGAAPFEYVDEADASGVAEHARYTVTACHYLQRYTPAVEVKAPGPDHAGKAAPKRKGRHGSLLDKIKGKAPAKRRRIASERLSKN